MRLSVMETPRQRTSLVKIWELAFVRNHRIERPAKALIMELSFQNVWERIRLQVVCVCPFSRVVMYPTARGGIVFL